jgi:hypothetical protein
MQRTALRARKILAFLNVRIGPTAVPLYRCAAADAQPVGRRSLVPTPIWYHSVNNQARYGVGISYTNITLKGIDHHQVAAYLKNQRRQAFVAPSVNSYTVVFDKEADAREQALQSLAVELSSSFECVAFAVLVHDGDLFAYWLYDAGQLLDSYDSAPSYFETAPSSVLPTGGNPEQLCASFEVAESLAEVRDIFERVAQTATADDWDETHLIGDEIHDVLVQALHLPHFAVDTGYYSIIHQSIPEDLDRTLLINCDGEAE